MKSQPPVSAEVIAEALNVYGSVKEAAAAMNVPERTLYRWMEHYGITRQSVFQKAA